MCIILQILEHNDLLTITIFRTHLFRVSTCHVWIRVKAGTFPNEHPSTLTRRQIRIWEWSTGVWVGHNNGRGFFVADHN